MYVLHRRKTRPMAGTSNQGVTKRWTHQRTRLLSRPYSRCCSVYQYCKDAGEAGEVGEQRKRNPFRSVAKTSPSLSVQGREGRSSYNGVPVAADRIYSNLRWSNISWLRRLTGREHRSKDVGPRAAKSFDPSTLK